MNLITELAKTGKSSWVLVVLKERWHGLSKIISPKAKLSLSEDGKSALLAPFNAGVTPALPAGPSKFQAQLERSALCAPAEQAGCLLSQVRELHGPAAPDFGGMPCAPAESESSDQSLDLGDRYTVLSKLGQGGSASVYKVQDNVLGKTFAVKVMRSELVPDNQAQLRFKQEAEAASCLTHPNLVAVYGSSITSDKAPYLIMDCLSGKSLAQLLQEEGALDSSRTIDILTQCCEALIHMHMKGLVHRDIKPSNIFLTTAENGTDLVKIVDFGIAKIQAYQDSTHLTQTGAVFGSPLYMSPEQCRGESLDFRSDIYSLGCVAYEMLTGVSPFAASNPIKTIVMHVNGSVEPLSKVVTKHEIPSALQSIIIRCLEREPQRRYQTVDVLLNHLTDFRDKGLLRTIPQDVYPPLYKRLAAALADGTILAILTLGTAIIGLNLSHSGQAIYFNDQLFTVTEGLAGPPCFQLCGLVLSITGAILFGPAVAIMVWLTSFVGANDSILPFLAPMLGLVYSMFYFPAFECSRYGGTPGKNLFGLVVVDSRGQRQSFAHAAARYFSKMFFFPLVLCECAIQIVLLAMSPSHWKELRLHQFRPPTDRWSGSYVINANVLNSIFMPNLREYLDEMIRSPREMSQRRKAVKIAIALTIFITLAWFLFGWRRALRGDSNLLLIVISINFLSFMYHFQFRRNRKRSLAARHKQSVFLVQSNRSR